MLRGDGLRSDAARLQRVETSAQSSVLAGVCDGLLYLTRDGSRMVCHNDDVFKFLGYYYVDYHVHCHCVSG